MRAKVQPLKSIFRLPNLLWCITPPAYWWERTNKGFTGYEPRVIVRGSGGEKSIDVQNRPVPDARWVKPRIVNRKRLFFK